VRYRYTTSVLIGDYVRAAGGFVFCLVPVFFSTVTWLTWLLAALALLFAIFGAKTAIRHGTTYDVDDERLATEGPIRRIVRWAELGRLKVAYYATRRDKNKGWMEATVGGPGGQVRVDSGLEGFHDIVTRAARAAVANKIELSTATRANLRAMDIYVAGLELEPQAGGASGV